MKKIRIIDDKKQWLPIYCVANLFLIQYLESHSTWVRELKSDSAWSKRHRQQSHSTWVRELKSLVSGTLEGTSESHSTWVRELKSRYSSKHPFNSRRTPRECVSWNFFIFRCRYNRQVALHVSAWVEIRLDAAQGSERWSHSTWVRELKFPL